MGGHLAGRVALVTGAAGGMGGAHARRLAADGAVVAVSDRAASPDLEALAQELHGMTAVGDVTDPGSVEGLVADIARKVGPVRILVANHAYMTMAPFDRDDEEDWWRVVDTNLTGTFNLVRAVVPGMIAAGGGRIVLIASEWGVTGWPGATAYAASKAGLISLTKTLGRELAPHGVVVNAIAPGVTDTPQLEVDAAAAGISLPAMHAEYARGIPLRRIGRPEEIAQAVSLLSDHRIGSMIGQIVQVNGGSTRSRV